MRIAGDANEPILTALNDSDELAVAPDGSLWIMEDADPGRLLHFRAGEQTIIAEGLWHPRGKTFRGDIDNRLMADLVSAAT